MTHHKDVPPLRTAAMPAQAGDVTQPKPWLHYLLPIAALTMVYMLMGELDADLVPWSADAWLRATDTWFGQPARVLAPFAEAWLEPLSAAYVLFIPYLYLSLLIALFSQTAKQRRILVLALIVTSAVSMLGHVLVPSQMPAATMAFDSSLQGGAFHPLATLLAKGPYGVFPSLHLGLTWTLCLFDWRHNRLRALLYLPLFVAIVLAALVLRFHYVVDILAAVLIATWALKWSERRHGMAVTHRRLWQFLMELFFERIDLVGRENLDRITGPCIVIANHPNAWVDPFVLEAGLQRPLWKTGRATIYDSWWLGKIAHRLKVIPLARQSDNQADRAAINARSFELINQQLQQGEWLLIFPEGKSHSEANAMPFKTGAARLAQQFIEATGQPITILPIGLLYRAKSLPYSRLVLNVGEPWQINTDDIQAQQPQALTEHFQQRLANLAPNYGSKTRQQLIPWVADVLTYSRRQPEPLGRRDRRTDEWVRNLAAANTFTQSNSSFNKPLRRLKRQTNQAGLSVTEVALPLHWSKVFRFIIREFELLSLGACYAALTLLMQWPAMALHAWITRHRIRGEDQYATYSIGTGLAIYPIYYLLLLIPAFWLGPLWVIWALLQPLLGYFTNLYLHRAVQSFRRMRTFFTLGLNRHSVLELRRHLHRLHDDMLSALATDKEKLE